MDMDVSYSSSSKASSIYNDSYYAELEKRILLLMGDDEDDEELVVIGEKNKENPTVTVPMSTPIALWAEQDTHFDRVGYRRRTPSTIPNLQPKPVNVTDNGNGTGVFIPLPVPRSVHSGKANNRQRRRTYKRVVAAAT